MTPTLIHGRARPEGEQVLSERAAARAVDMLRQVVTRGTARQAEVEGYEVAGKTGTADKPRPSGGYYDNKVVANIVTVFPASAPRYVLIVVLDEPNVPGAGRAARTAGTTAAPVAQALIRRLAPLVGLEPDIDEKLPVFEPRFAPRVESSSGDALKVVANQ